MYIYRTGKGTAIEDQAFTCYVLLTDRGNPEAKKWLEKACLKHSTEILIMAAEEEAISTASKEA